LVISKRVTSYFALRAVTSYKKPLSISPEGRNSFSLGEGAGMRRLF